MRSYKTKGYDMKIELDPDMCDEIVAATLVATYKLLKNDIKKAKKNPNHYAPEAPRKVPNCFRHFGAGL